jgi:hypothetical protein
MKKIKYILAAAIVALSYGCSDDFGDMNTPGDATTQVEPKFFLHKIESAVFNNYQRNINLYDDFYSQYWANAVDGFESGRYEYVDGWVGNAWREHYTEHLRRSNAIVQMYGKNDLYKNAVAIQDIFMVYLWSRLTDKYGDVPYTGASEGESVTYMSQQEIYTDLFARLDADVKALSNDSKQYAYGSQYDLIYQGDVNKWKRFGNSLRLRLAMRISNVDRAKAQTEAQAAINGDGGLMTSNDDAAKVPMWAKGWYDYLHQMAWNWRNIACSKTFTDYLYSQSSVGEDPRTPIWFAYNKDGEPVTKESVGKARYEGLENGLNIIDDSFKTEIATINLKGGYQDFVGNGDNQMYCPVMFYSEVKFLLAEAALRGWYSGNAEALYKEGIQASMEYVGVSTADATAYITGLPSFSGLANNEAKLKQLITQKWISNFPNGVEAWSDFRRTDYPDLTLPADPSSSATVAAGTWVKRVNYPNNEHRINEANMPEALNSTTKDRMDVKVWWDTTDTKTKSNGLMNSNF